MGDKNHASTGRFVCVVDPKVTSVEEAARKLAERGIAVDDKLDFIGTLVVRGSEKDVRTATGQIEGITSVEPEGIMKTQ